MDAKKPHEWHINDDDDLWLRRFAITKNKHVFRATPGREHLLFQIGYIENNTEREKDLTRNEITDLLRQSTTAFLMQSTTISKQETKMREESKEGGLPPPERWKEHMERSMERDLEQDELSLENLSVGDHPPTEQDEATVASTPMDMTCPEKKGIKRGASTNLVDTDVTPLTSLILAINVPPIATKTCFTQFLQTNSSQFDSILDVIGQFVEGATTCDTPNAAFVYVNSREDAQILIDGFKEHSYFGKKCTMHIVQNEDTVKMHDVTVSPTAEKLAKDSLVNFVKLHYPITKQYEFFHAFKVLVTAEEIGNWFYTLPNGTNELS